MAGQTDVLLVNLPFQLEREFIDYPYHHNYCLLAQGAYLREHGIDVQVFDAFAQDDSILFPIPDGTGWWMGCSFETVQGALPTWQPKVVAALMHPFLFAPFNKGELVAFLADLRAAYGETPLALVDAYTGGMHYIEYDAHEWIGPGRADYVLKYETEATLLALLQGLLAGERPVKRVHLPEARIPVKDLPLPAFDLIDWEKYQAFLRDCFGPNQLNDQFRAVDGIPYKLGRGCPYQCSFCSVNPNPDPGQKKPSFLPVEVFKEQIAFLAECYHEKRLHFLDEVANAHPHFEQILQILADGGWEYDFPNGFRAERLKESHLDLMQGRVGVLSISAESGSQRVLDEIVRKQLKVEDIERVAGWCKDREQPLLVHFMIGLPGETREEINETLRFAAKLQDEYGAQASVQYATAFPGTALDQAARKDASQALSSEQNYYAMPFHRPHLRPGSDITFEELRLFRENFQVRGTATKPQKVIINLTYRCSNNCRFCATGDRVFIDGDFEKQKKILRDYREMGVRLVDFDGGEPTLYDKLFEIISYAHGLGYHRLNLTTNGRKLKDVAYARRIIHSGLTDLLISLHGPNAEVHDANVQAPNSFHETLQGIVNAVNLKPEGFAFGVNVTVTAHNYEHLETMAQLLVNIGVPRFNIQLLTPFGAVYTDTIIPMEKVAPKLMSLIDNYGDKLDLQLINMPFCYMPGYEQYLMSDTFKFGRHMLFADTISGAVNLATYLASRRYKNEQCAKCPYDSICNGFYDFSEDQDTIIPDLVEAIGSR